MEGVRLRTVDLGLGMPGLCLRAQPSLRMALHQLAQLRDPVVFSGIGYINHGSKSGFVADDPIVPTAVKDYVV